MKKLAPLGLFVLFLLAACAGPPVIQTTTETKQSQDFIVYRTPT